MNEKTRYHYEKRIASLKEELLQSQIERNIYKGICSTIDTTVLDMVTNNKQISQAWILQQFRIAWK